MEGWGGTHVEGQDGVGWVCNWHRVRNCLRLELMKETEASGFRETDYFSQKEIKKKK